LRVSNYVYPLIVHMSSQVLVLTIDFQNQAIIKSNHQAHDCKMDRRDACCHQHICADTGGWGGLMAVHGSYCTSLPIAPLAPGHQHAFDRRCHPHRIWLVWRVLPTVYRLLLCCTASSPCSV